MMVGCSKVLVFLAMMFLSTASVAIQDIYLKVQGCVVQYPLTGWDPHDLPERLALFPSHSVLGSYSQPGSLKVAIRTL